MKRQALLSIVVLLAVGGGLARTAYAAPPIPPLASMAVSALAQRLHDGNASVRQAAVLALGEMGPAANAAIPDLARVLRDRDRYVAVDAGHTLEKIGPDVVPSVAAMLFDPDPRVRELAAQTLRKIGPDAKAAVPALAQRLRDCSASVRQASVLALADIGPAAKSAIADLAQSIRDPDKYIATDAAHTLGRLGPEVIPSLTPLLEDRNPAVRERAALTFRQIGLENVVK